MAMLLLITAYRSNALLRHLWTLIRFGCNTTTIIFSIESTGQWDSDELFLEAVKTLKKKCQALRPQVTNMVYTY